MDGMGDQSGFVFSDSIKVGFIGFGFMAQSLCRGFIASNVVKAVNIICYDVNQDSLTVTLHTFPLVQRAMNNQQVVDFSDVIIIAVKPNAVSAILADAKLVTRKERHVFMSIAAGITTAQLEQGLPLGTRVVRVMPNSCVAVQCGTTVVCRGTYATQQDEELAICLFSSVGFCMSLPEKHLNCVTAISGSGPGYVYMALDAVGDGGSMMGLPRDVAQKLAAHTMIGAAQMFLQTDKHPGALKDSVCSPGGTTLAGINHLENGHFRGLLIGTVKAGVDRAEELARDHH